VYWLNVRNDYPVNDFEVHNEPNNATEGWGGTINDYAATATLPSCMERLDLLRDFHLRSGYFQVGTRIALQSHQRSIHGSIGCLKPILNSCMQTPSGRIGGQERDRSSNPSETPGVISR
jgi:hypothetical protein